MPVPISLFMNWIYLKKKMTFLGRGPSLTEYMGLDLPAPAGAALPSTIGSKGPWAHRRQGDRQKSPSFPPLSSGPWSNCAAHLPGQMITTLRFFSTFPSSPPEAGAITPPSSSTPPSSLASGSLPLRVSWSTLPWWTLLPLILGVWIPLFS